MSFVNLEMDGLLKSKKVLFPRFTDWIVSYQRQQHHCKFFGNPHAKRKYVSQQLQMVNQQEGSWLLQESKPGEITCKSQKLMLLTGLIRHASPGCYHYMPYTVRAMEKLIQLIDQEMQAIGGQKISMPTLCSAELWRASGRWELMGKELLQLSDRHTKEYCLGPTHEEAITNLVASQGYLSYKQLPLLLYQVTRKFRDEPKPRFGLLRSREFYMKDMYTFDASEEAALKTYALVCNAYCNVFNRLGLQFVKVQAPTGSIGGTLSHEFQLPADIGEDQLMMCTNCDFSANAETINPSKVHCPVCEGKLMEKRGIEVGHAFYLGTKYSSIFNTLVKTAESKSVTAEMGCYGLGVSRILAAAIEVLSTEDAIRWPNLIAPYQICLIPPKRGSKEENAAVLLEELHDCIAEAVPNLRDEIVLDDRTQSSIGKRLIDANKCGYPYVIIGGKKCLDVPSLFEVQNQNTGEVLFLTKEAIIDLLSKVHTS